MNAEPPWLSRPRRSDLAGLLLLSFATGAGAFEMARRMVAADPASDYGVHLQLAETMARTSRITVPQLLYHVTLLLTRAVVPGSSLAMAAALNSAAYTVLLAVTVYAVLRPAFGAAASRAGVVRTVVAVVIVLLVTPVTVPTWQEQNLYLGYIGINVFHNPTILALKPLALLLLLAAGHAFTAEAPRPLAIAAGGLLAVLATLAKPNYTLCLLPALAVLAAVRLMRRQPVHWALLAAVALPAAAVLAWQYSLAYSPSESILWAPLAVALNFTSYESLLPKVLLSVVFPAGVYLAYFSRARHALLLNLCWVAFLVSLLYHFLLAESGERMFHLNFTWGAQAALFILFVVSVRFWLMQLSPAGQSRRLDWHFVRGAACAALLLLHLLSGLLWYWTQLNNPFSAWW